jgi:hypothetical protein
VDECRRDANKLAELQISRLKEDLACGRENMARSEGQHVDGNVVEEQ